MGRVAPVGHGGRKAREPENGGFPAVANWGIGKMLSVTTSTGRGQRMGSAGVGLGTGGDGDVRI